jgi:hypothetical protein
VISLAINQEKSNIMPTNKFTWLSRSAIDIMKISKLIASATLLSIGLLFSSSVIAGDKQKLPFVGTRSFNFLGGTATGLNITIEKNGNTTISYDYKTAGKRISGVSYKGKFSNPIDLKDGSGILGQTCRYLFKNNKVYAISADGKIIKGCRGEGTICESALD